MHFIKFIAASGLAALPLVYGNPTNNVVRSVSDLSARQDLPTLPSIPAGCQKSCTSGISPSCTSPDCSCTESNAGALETCLNCVIKDDKSTTDTCQKFIDSFTSSCTSLGKPLKARSLSGSSSSSSGSSGSGSSGSSKSGNGNAASKTAAVSLGALGAVAGSFALLL
ncbi:hypothetical protein PQX77_002599 [Marasmius sp. AFHP31]|nr:hypothetical protein PQX77_002599 [Marasmius sp. AFHP31]